MEIQQEYLNPNGFSKIYLEDSTKADQFKDRANDFNKIWLNIGSKINEPPNNPQTLEVYSTSSSEEEKRKIKALYESATSNVITISKLFFLMIEDVEKLSQIKQPSQSDYQLVQIDAKTTYQNISSHLKLFQSRITTLIDTKQLSTTLCADLRFSLTKVSQCEATWKLIYEKSAKLIDINIDEVFDQKEVSQDRPRSMTYKKIEEGATKDKRSMSWNKKLTNSFISQLFHQTDKPLPAQEEPQPLLPVAQEGKEQKNAPAQPAILPPLPIKELPPLPKPESTSPKVSVKELTRHFNQIDEQVLTRERK